MSSKIIILLCVSLLWIFSCASAPTKKQQDKSTLWQWPLPPDEPKIRFVRYWNGEQDFDRRNSMKELLLGKEQKRDWTKLVKPYGIASNGKGEVFVCDTILGKVFVFDVGQKRVRYIGLEGPGALRKPIGITTSADNDVWIADAERKIVIRYHSDGAPARFYGNTGEMSNPTSVALDESRSRLYVSDSHAHKILVYDTGTGQLKTSIGERGVEEGEFNYPTNIAVDPQGYLYVVDTMNFRIQIFDPDGNFDTSFGTPGDQPGTLARPRGIAVDAQGNIFIADAIHNSVQVYNPDFELLMWLGGYQGIGPGEFIQPSGIWISGGNLYVADSLNHRVQVFKLLYMPG